MRPSLRKLLGTLAIFVLVSAYALVTMAFGARVLANAPEWSSVLFYAAAGVIWALPALPLVRWMQRMPQP